MRNPKLLVLDQTEELSLQVERVTAALRPRPEVVWCDGFKAIEMLTDDGEPFDVLIAGSLVSEDDGFQRLRRLRERAPDTRLILAFDRWRSGSLRDTVRTGALDILRLPVSNEDLLEAVEQALDMGPVPSFAPIGEQGPGLRGPNAVAGLRGPNAVAGLRGPNAVAANGPGTVVAVLSATGGCGKTFFATNLAYHLHARFQQRTCLIDLDLQFGELSTALRLKPRYTIHDLLSQDLDEDELADRLEDHLVRHESGIHLLAAPDEPADADALEASDVARVIEAARSRFDYVVIDTPAALSEPVLAILDQTDQIFALATLDLPSVRNLGVLLTTLKKLKVPADRVKLILNKVEPDVGIDVAGVSQYFPQGFSMVIPYGREVNRALNMGQPVLAYAPRGEVSKTLDAGLHSTLGLGGGTGPGGEHASRLRRRFGWRQKKSA